MVATGPHLVEVWSTTRPPFEPQGWLKAMRAELRSALLDITPKEGGVLRACYASPVVRPGVDVENVLLYNVGSRCLRPLIRRGVVIERSYTITATSPDPGLVHHLLYEAVGRDAGFVHWSAGDQLGSFSGVHVARIKCAPLWAAIRTQADPPNQTYDAPVPFVLRADLRCPRTIALESRSLPDLVEHLLDGLVSAFHSHDSHDSDSEVVARLAASGLDGPAAIAATLADARWSALGPRRLVRLGQKGVVWNPADDLCVAADIRFSQGTNTEEWEVAGEVLSARPSPARLGPQSEGPMRAEPNRVGRGRSGSDHIRATLAEAEPTHWFQTSLPTKAVDTGVPIDPGHVGPAPRRQSALCLHTQDNSRSEVGYSLASGSQSYQPPVRQALDGANAGEAQVPSVVWEPRRISCPRASLRRPRRSAVGPQQPRTSPPLR